MATKIPHMGFGSHVSGALTPGTFLVCPPGRGSVASVQTVNLKHHIIIYRY